MARRGGAAEQHKHKPRDIRPQGKDSGLDADLLRGKTDAEIGSGIISNPPAGKSKITNYYWDPDTKELVVIVET